MVSRGKKRERWKELPPPYSHPGNGISSGLHNFAAAAQIELGRAFSLQIAQMASSAVLLLSFPLLGELNSSLGNVLGHRPRPLQRQHSPSKMSVRGTRAFPERLPTSEEHIPLLSKASRRSPKNIWVNILSSSLAPVKAMNGTWPEPVRVFPC